MSTAAQDIIELNARIAQTELTLCHLRMLRDIRLQAIERDFKNAAIPGFDNSTTQLLTAVEAAEINECELQDPERWDSLS